MPMVTLTASQTGRRSMRLTAALIPLLLAGGCANFATLAIEPSHREPGGGRSSSEGGVPAAEGGRGGVEPDTLQLPGARPPATSARVPATAEQIARLVPDESVEMALVAQPIPQFIATVIGGVLGLPYSMGPEAATRTEVISGGTGGSISKRDLFRLTQQALRQYAIEIYIDNGLVTVGASDTSVGGAQLVRNREISNAQAGRVVQFFTAQTVEVNALQPLLNDLFPNLRGARITPDQTSNSLIISGSPREVSAIVRALREIDQPRFAGGQVIRHAPVFWPADNFATSLEQALVAEGYVVSRMASARRGITILTFAQANQLLVFSDDPALLERVRYWIATLDQPAALGDKTSTFVYEVLNTDAQSLGQLAIGQSPQAPQAPRPAGVPGAPPVVSSDGASRTTNTQNQAGGGSQGQFMNGRLIVDQIGNRIIFTGTATDFAALEGLLRALDRPAPQVVIEVLIAEVTLTDVTRLGLEFWGTETRGDGVVSGGTEGGLGLGANGALVTFVGPEFRAALNAEASNNRINILQRPRLVARSGGSARFQVGTDVPIITSQRATTSQSGSTGTDILQSVQYRQTGVILDVQPVVYGDWVDITISQEMSSAGDASGAIASPPILNRSLTTQIAIPTGQTGVLGGLISNNYNKGNTGIPFLKDIPILGSAFQTNTVRGERTEILVLITPRVIRDEIDMGDLVDRYVEDMESAFRTGRGWSYTLTPWSFGRSVRGVGFDLPTADAASERPPLLPRRPAPVVIQNEPTPDEADEAPQSENS